MEPATGAVLDATTAYILIGILLLVGTGLFYLAARNASKATALQNASFRESAKPTPPGPRRVATDTVVGDTSSTLGAVTAAQEPLPKTAERSEIADDKTP
jgi:hypothetical protein